MADEQIHAGHRKRLLERFQTAGLRSFSDIEVLELLLTFAIPRRDTNPIAHRLLDRFSSLHTVFDAPIESLTQVEGVTPRAASLLHLIPAVWSRYSECRAEQTRYLCSVEDYSSVLVPRFHGVREEHVWMLSMDAKCKLLDCRELCSGSIGSVNLSVRRVSRIVKISMFMDRYPAHNHPTGIAVPSQEDVETTRRLAAALDLVEVRLMDHLIVADDDYISLYLSGLMQWNQRGYL